MRWIPLDPTPLFPALYSASNAATGSKASPVAACTDGSCGTVPADARAWVSMLRAISWRLLCTRKRPSPRGGAVRRLRRPVRPIAAVSMARLRLLATTTEVGASGSPRSTLTHRSTSPPTGTASSRCWHSAAAWSIPLEDSGASRNTLSMAASRKSSLNRALRSRNGNAGPNPRLKTSFHVLSQWRTKTTRFRVPKPPGERCPASGVEPQRVSLLRSMWRRPAPYLTTLSATYVAAGTRSTTPTGTRARVHTAVPTTPTMSRSTR
mmetsp:Transcript_16020/g.54625  ORF Transcript_16020/g.54625 Transcript_16020/m.54625 type:complete len:265 (-) Transcript_16020:75-869(-)